MCRQARNEVFVGSGAEHGDDFGGVEGGAGGGIADETVGGVAGADEGVGDGVADVAVRSCDEDGFCAGLGGWGRHGDGGVG